MTRTRRSARETRVAIIAALSLLAMALLAGCSAPDPGPVQSAPAQSAPPQTSAQETGTPLLPAAPESAAVVVKPNPGPSPAPARKPGPGPAPRIELQAAAITRVVDGDTAWVTIKSTGVTEKVRFIGVDTPENTIQVEPYGAAASAYAKRHLTSKTVYLETDAEQRDRYGRLLAYIWMSKPVSAQPYGRPTLAQAKERMFNAWLVRDGFAQTMTIPPNVKYEDYFLTLQSAARDADKGLWNPSLIEKSSGSNAEKGAFVGNQDSRKFHKTSCRWASKISDSNKTSFSSRKAAVAAGYVPCKVCRP